MDFFYLILADSMVAVPQFRSYFDNLYQTQKVRFYEKAKEHKYYDYLLMRDKPLALEVSMKRAFGILLCSRDDEQLQENIVKEILQVYPQLKILDQNFSLSKYEKIELEHHDRCDRKRSSMCERNSFSYCSAYVAYCIHGPDAKNPDIQQMYSTTAECVEVGMHRDPYRQLRKSLDIINAKQYLKLFREQRKLLDALQTGHDIMDLQQVFMFHFLPNQNQSKHLTLIRTSSIAQKELLLQPFLNRGKREYVMDMSPLLIAIAQFDYYGLSLMDYLEGMTISAEERSRVLKVIARDWAVCFPGTELQIYGFTVYLYTLLFGLLARIIRESKDFYFENNSETQYNELKKAAAENAALEERMSRLNESLQYQEQHNSVLKSQIESLSAELSKDVKDAVRPLRDEISLLRAQIAELEKELVDEREKTDELNRLREFAFSIHSGSDIPSTKVSPNDLIAGKRIYIFGGHINWRNKMKSAYPILNILDGHQTSFDEKMLLGADMVLLNTSNMSHAVYYKVIDVLRKNSIPFDYIGKYRNAELLEQEIAEVLQK